MLRSYIQLTLQNVKIYAEVQQVKHIETANSCLRNINYNSEALFRKSTPVKLQSTSNLKNEAHKVGVHPHPQKCNLPFLR